MLSFLVDYIEENGYPPTHEEIGEEIGIVKSGVSRYLDILQEEGYISRKARTARGISLR